MTSYEFAWSVIGMLTIGCGYGAQLDDNTAIAMLQKHECKFIRETGKPGMPVIEIAMAGQLLDDELLSVVPVFKQLQSLSIVTDGDNVGQALQSLEDMKQLRRLVIRRCKLRDVDVTRIATVSGLRVLDIRIVGMTDARLKELSNLKDLQELHIKGEDVTNAGMSEIGMLTHLQILSLRNTRVGDVGLRDVAKISNLQELNLVQTEITDQGLKEFTSLKKLKKLELWGTRVSNSGLQYLAKISGLEALSIGGNITDDGLRELAGSKGLKSLVLADPRITDTGVGHLVGLTRLEFLDLSRTSVTEAGVATLKTSLPTCKIVWGAKSPPSQHERNGFGVGIGLLNELRLGGTPCKGVVGTAMSQHLYSLSVSGRVAVMRSTDPHTGRCYLGKHLRRYDARARPAKIEMNDTIKTELAREGLLDLVARRAEVGEITC
jgi:Leucine Rich repeat